MSFGGDLIKGFFKVIIPAAGMTIAAYGVGRAASSKNRQQTRELVNEPRKKYMNGVLYEELPDGTLVPYWVNHPTDNGDGGYGRNNGGYRHRSNNSYHHKKKKKHYNNDYQNRKRRRYE